MIAGKDTTERPNGTITDLAKKHHVSRTSIYNWRDFFKQLEGDYNASSNLASHFEDKEEILKLILTLRLSCKASIPGISETLKILGYKFGSVGYVSEILKNISTFAINDIPPTSQSIGILADEIFIGGTPILVIIDAVSHAILAIEIAKDRTGETWSKCFMSLIDKG